MTSDLPRPLISATQLQALYAGGAPLVVLDAGFDLADTPQGERDHAAGHLPQAQYAHLERDLCGPLQPRGNSHFKGRHPLPSRSDFAATAGRWGITPQTAVVVYDRQRAMYAARLWWMLRWLGHAQVSVLDGGLQAWQAAGGPLVTAGTASAAGAEPPMAPAYPQQPPLVDTIDADALQAGLGRVRLLDARAPERYRGELEPLDAAAGHIPGALNRFFQLNVQADGRFKPAEVLHAEFTALALAGADNGAPTVHQCGSGVTACHNLLAMEIAGLPGGLLYPGSWSEWSSSPARPVALG